MAQLAAGGDVAPPPCACCCLPAALSSHTTHPHAPATHPPTHIHQRQAAHCSLLQACGKEEECLEVYRTLEKSHPVPAIRRQATGLRYIMEAPKLEISPEERVSIPLMTDLQANRCAQQGGAARGRMGGRIGRVGEVVSGCFWGLVWGWGLKEQRAWIRAALRV